MKLSQLNIEALSFADIDRLLFEGLEYTGEAADAIMVLGSRKACEHRVPTAARLYRSGRAERIILSGGKCQQTKHGVMHEYKAMTIEAKLLGLPESALITECRSMNTAENFSFTRPLLEKDYPDCRKIIVVTAAYHMRRAMLLADKIMSGFMILPCPADTGSTTKKLWKNSEKGIQTAYGEARKLKDYAQKGYIADTEIL
jgi:uncharacterized SAM-binding protein YcdF (DUF218 family)